MTSDSAAEPPAQDSPPPAEPAASPVGDGATEPVATPSGRRTWSMPKSPISREQADQAGRAALKAGSAVGRFLADVGRYTARCVAQLGRAIEAVPVTLRLFVFAAIVMLLGIVGATASNDALGLLCTAVVIPVCAATLGVLGQRWYSGLRDQPARQTSGQAAAPSDLQRSVEYVDKKLAVALTAMGTERHQQAVISLFQAKTALELTLGTEQDSATFFEMPAPADDHPLRPRIRVGSKTQLRESNSLVAS
ncbi:hypothetical protein [Mycolicibacterium goodii]|uniref:hypothetical protein n=1 Tax=Mycolicibacterium goodii TaxID=134601 RepID=UPI0029700884